MTANLTSVPKACFTLGMEIVRIKGHRLETISTNGGILATCTCGVAHCPPTGIRQVFASWERTTKVRAAHQAHLAAVVKAAR